MYSLWTLSALALAYLATLFAIAQAGDRLELYPRVAALRPWVYSLALGVYCTSWTFYGAVGSAVRDGWSYLPVYLGPALVYLLAMPFLSRLVLVGRTQRLASIADFVAARFGKSRALAVLVTTIACVAAIPYLALQYKAVAGAIGVLAGHPVATLHWWSDPALPVALVMAVFAVLYGARRVDSSEHRQGLMLAIAFESLVKAVAFAAVGLYAWRTLPEGAPLLPGRMASAATLLRPDALATTLLAAAAIFCLPRQYLVGVVECAEPADLRRARWALPAYLAVFSAFVVPIVALHAAGGTPAGPADSLVLTLPLAHGHGGLALLAFIGGLSAATAMVVVASITLATMIANEIAAPLVWRRELEAGANLGPRLLWVRRAAILGLALLAFAFHRVAPGGASLASIGVLSFAAVAQFAPAMFAALYWPGTSRGGVMLGQAAGFAAWATFLFLPNLHGAGVPLGTVATGGVLALALNIAIVAAVTRLRPASLQDRLLARDFVREPRPRAGEAPLPAIRASVADLEAVAARIVGAEAAREAVAGYARVAGLAPPRPGDLADRGILLHVERLLAASLGAPSARVVLTHALRRKGLGVDEVAALLDETSQELRFGRQVLQATLDNVTQGISVVDANLNLAAWNRRYLEMFGYPEGLAAVGRPVADLIRFNALRGEFGPGDPEAQVAKRLAHLRAGTAYEYQRTRPDGRVYSIQGRRVPGGGFVTTYTDVTEFKRAEGALLEAKQGLEERVAQRTRELSAAKQQAEEANASKTRFVAAATHDLLQPLNAARLFASALAARCQEDEGLRPSADLAARIDDSMRVAEEMLGDLLDVARLDAGALRPEVVDVPVAELLDDLQRQYAPVARARRLRLRVLRSRAVVRSDRTMLRRILQNYLANALRYTRSGGVTLGCRRRGGALELQVLDTGPGIPPEQTRQLYEAFNRLGKDSPWGERGTGLGLSICDRFAALLGHQLTLATRVGHGSCFGVRLERASTVAALPRPPPPRAAGPLDLGRMRVLCVDNDGDILAGMEALLGQWGLQVDKALDAGSALQAAQAGPDALLVDFHLGAGMDGLELAREARRRMPGLPVVLVTADRSATLAAAARAEEIPVLHKPVRPAALRAVLGAARRRATTG